MQCRFFIIRHKIKITGKSLQQPAQSFSSCWLSTSTLPNSTNRNMGGNVRQIISNSSVHTFYIITEKRSNASPNLYSANKDQRSSHLPKKEKKQQQSPQMTRRQKKERKKKH